MEGLKMECFICDMILHKSISGNYICPLHGFLLENNRSGLTPDLILNIMGEYIKREAEL